MAGLLGAIGRVLGNSVKNAVKNAEKKAKESSSSSNKSSSSKSSSSSSDYSNKQGYDANSGTWGLGNPNQSYEEQKKAEEYYYNNTPEGRAEKERMNQQKEHMDWINKTYNGGFDGYYADQQKKYNDALRSGDNDMLKRLEQDSQRVGYTLTPGNGGYNNSGGSSYGGGYNQQSPVYDTPLYNDDYFKQQNDEYMKRMEDYYRQQQEAFDEQIRNQDELRKQEEERQNALKLKNDRDNAYREHNKDGISGIGGSLGGYDGYNSNQYKQGAHIKLNNNGQPGAISRYLTKDIWANK